MHSLRKQRTIAEAAVVEGFGYWSGKDVRVEFRPAAADTGIVFVRCDLTSPVKISADVFSRIEMPRRTTLTSGGARVEMVEHIMAALAGLCIDNCEVWTDAGEMPGLDGSSQRFVEALDRVGIRTLEAPRPKLVIRETTRLGNEEAWIEARPAQRDGLTLKYKLDYGADSPIGRQSLELTITPEVFRRDLAACRTFMTRAEADWLLAQGLGRRASTQDLLVYGDDGPIDNELRFPDECVRHKLLDLVGDLALAGCDLSGQIIAHRSGHRQNAELVRLLLAEGEMIQPRRKSA